MNYQQFVVVIKEKVAHSLGDGIFVKMHTALKNNGKERIGLTISDKQVNIFPTIYLEEYFKQFQKGNSIDAITESILAVYQEVKFEHTWQVSSIKDFSTVKQKIVPKLIHAEKNRTLLQLVPHICYLDFAITFYILFGVDECGIATIPITNELLEWWNVTSDELYHISLKNSTNLLPATFKPMRTVIDELLGNSCDDVTSQDDIMFVLTNQIRNFGAACILYHDILEQIAGQLGENFYILPSSIHEVIVIPESQCPNNNDLNDMVKEINDTQVDEEEVLSDRAYYYDCMKMQLS